VARRRPVPNWPRVRRAAPLALLAAVLVACGSRSADPHGTAVQAVAGPVAEQLAGAAAGRGLAGVSVAPDGLPERAPQLLQPPQSMLVREGDSVLFSVEAVGTAPLQYQWLRDGATIAGARGASGRRAVWLARPLGLTHDRARTAAASRRPTPAPARVLAGAPRRRPARACPMNRDLAATRRGAAEQTRSVRYPERPC
jgi:hypothetical protein